MDEKPQDEWFYPHEVVTNNSAAQIPLHSKPEQTNQ
jgi:hypothetical protein